MRDARDAQKMYGHDFWCAVRNERGMFKEGREEKRGRAWRVIKEREGTKKKEEYI